MIMVLTAGVPLLMLPASADGLPPRERTSFDQGWRFIKDDPADVGDQFSYAKIKDWFLPTSHDLTTNAALLALTLPATNPIPDVAYARPDYDDSQWRLLNLPHDWGIEGPFKQEYDGETGKLPCWGVAWYRHHLPLTADDQGRRIFLDVDGAMAYASVWVNGHLAGGWPYGYASWRIDLTPYLKFGADNVIAIRLDNPPDSSRWYPGGGIYRNVWIVKTATGVCGALGHLCHHPGSGREIGDHQNGRRFGQHGGRRRRRHGEE